MKKVLLLLSAPARITAVQAQTSAPSRPRTWEVEVDPIAYLLKGYSVHGIYQPGRWRFDAGLFGIRAPESFHGNKGYTSDMRGYGLNAHYLIRGAKGLYTGVGTGHSRIIARHRDTGATDTGHSVGVGAEVGYRIFLQKREDGSPTGFYLSPWVSVNYDVHYDKIRFADLAYKQSNWGFFPTVHVGYRF